MIDRGELQYHITYWDLTRYVDVCDFRPYSQETRFELENMLLRGGYVYQGAFNNLLPHYRVEAFTGEWLTETYKVRNVTYYYKNEPREQE